MHFPGVTTVAKCVEVIFLVSIAFLQMEKKQHNFWDSQPVIHEGEEIPEEAKPLAPQKTVDEIPKEPYPVPSTFEWWSPDYSKKEDIQALYEFLRDNYVEDKESMLRFNYSCEFLLWALTPPGYIPDWHVGVRRKCDKKLLGFIAGIPITLRMDTYRPEEEPPEGRRICEINFLCVHKALRVKSLAPLLIKEVTRRVNLHNIWQAVYTAGIDLPTPFTVAPYYHRGLNPGKLVDTHFSSIPTKLRKLRNPAAAYAKSLTLPRTLATKNLRPMKEEDIPGLTKLLAGYLLGFQVAPLFNEEEVAHFFLPRESVVSTYVVDNNGEITDFFSYYSIPSALIANAKYSHINAAYVHYYAHTRTPLKQLMSDLLIIASENGFDVCNIVEIMEGSTFTKDLKFHIGDGSLRYYFYNWAYPIIKPHKVGLVMLNGLSYGVQDRHYNAIDMTTANDNFNPFLSPKPFPVTVYVRLSSVYPCVPQELILRQYTKAFGISDYSPSSLVEALFPANLAQFVPPESCGEAVHDSIKKNKSMRRPPLPRENIRNDVMQSEPDKKLVSKVGVTSMFSFPRLGSTIACVCCLREPNEPFLSEEDTQFLMGYDTGAVIVVSLKQYGAQLESMRMAEFKADILGEDATLPESEGGLSIHLWGTSRTPSGVELQGYHHSGKVLCVTHDCNVDLGITGGADGVLYLWDIRNRHGTAKRNLINQSQVTRSSATSQFSEAVRNRRLLHSIKGAHDGPVSAVTMYTTFLITGGADKKVRIWQCEVAKNGTPQTYVVFQEFSMEGWVRSVTAAPLRGVQMDDVLVTDDNGVMMGLKACTAEMKSVFTRSRTDIGSGPELDIPKVRSVTGDGKLTFCVTRTHHFFSEESMRIGPSRVRFKEEISNTMLRVIPIMNYTALLSVTFSPIVRLMDYAHLRVSAKVQHPSLTAIGAKVNAKAASSVYRNENERRRQVFDEKKENLEQGNRLEPNSSAKLETLRSEPLRFIDALYIPMYDIILLLDNRNTVFVYERNSNDVLAKVSISSSNEEGKPKKAKELLPVGRCYNDATELSKTSSESLLEGRDFSIPFFVLTDRSVDLFHVLPTRNTVIEVPAHKTAVVGLAYRQKEEKDPDEIKTVEEKADNETRNLYISVSIDGDMICWGRGLHFLRMYEQKNTVVQQNTVERSLAAKMKLVRGGRTENAKSEITAFLFSEKWGLAVTGHDSGDIRYWGCDGELSDISLRENFHSNTVSGLAEAYTTHTTGRGSDQEEQLITVSFDGCMGIWGSPERRSAILKEKIRITFNELMCVVFAPCQNMYVTGDSSGALYFICVRERTVLFSIPSNTSVENPIELLWRPKGTEFPFHRSCVTSICMLGEDKTVSCDDDGCIFLRQFKDDEKASIPFSLQTPHSVMPEEKHSRELNCLVSVTDKKFIVAARSGHVYYFNVDERTYPIGIYKHSCEVCSLVVRPIRNDGFEFLIGGADGSITSLAESYFQPAHITVFHVMAAVSLVRQLKMHSDEEIVYRNSVFSFQKDDFRELEYRSVMDRYHNLPLPVSRPSPTDNRNGASKYFKCFHESFVYSEKRKLKELQNQIEKAESQVRYQLFRMEQESFAVICRSMAPHLKGILPGLMFVNALLPADAEQVSRQLIVYEYFQMLQEALIVQEILHRRRIVFASEPDARWRIEGAEPTEWIAARRKQVERGDMMKRGCMTEDHERTMEYIKWYAQQQNQITLFERREVEERMDVERLERLNAGIFADMYAADFRELRYKQLKYELAKRRLNEKDVKTLSIEETSARSHVVCEQYDRFKEIKGIEIINYLATRRNTLINERIECPPRDLGEVLFIVDQWSMHGVLLQGVSILGTSRSMMVVSLGLFVAFSLSMSVKIFLVNQQFSNSVVQAVLSSDASEELDYKSVFVLETKGFKETVNTWLNPLHRNESVQRRIREIPDSSSVSSVDDE
eukprot:gene13398-9221_t